MNASTMKSSRISVLQDKLTQYQLTNRTEREKYRQDVERSIRKIDEALHLQTYQNRQYFSALKENFYTIYNAISTQKTQRELGDEKKMKEIKVVEAAILVDFNVERQRRKDLEQKFRDLMVQREQEIADMLYDEIKANAQANQDQKNYVISECQKMLDEINQQKDEKDKLISQINLSMKDEYNKLKVAIAQERKERIDGTDTLYNQLTYIAYQLQQKLKAEREEREATEEGLMSLLEMTCKKVEEGM